MINASFFSPSRSRRPRAHFSRRICPLALVTFFALVASAQANHATAITACTPATGNSVTFNWAQFANPPGIGNGGRNTPSWQIVYTPTVGAPVTLSGSVSFPLDSYSLTVPVPSGAGSLAVSSSWTASQTTDASANSFSTTLTVPNCLASPAIATKASAGAPAGGTITDVATLSGGRSPTGTITFKLYAASDTTCSTALSAGTATVNGNGDYTSPAVTESTAGTYQWTASYSGDANNVPVAEGCGQPAEQVVVPPGPPPPTTSTPSIVTTASPGQVVGSPFFDTAVLSGGTSPTGTITFKLYNATDTSCSNALKTGTVTVNGNGSYTSPAVTETAVGSYQWTASYSGDANNAPAVEGCNQAAEKILISSRPPHPVVCTAHPHLTGVFGRVGNSVTARVGSLGVKSVTFYLDGRKLKTVTKAQGGFFSITIITTNLRFGQHRVTAKTKMSTRVCKPLSLASSFIHFNPTPPPPQPTG
ncbi:MAG: hypothetical protein M3065_08805 [Actinomycetota bacterium]|nr:hypothetical protein [Actinomycetota bacterium]